MPDQMTLEDYLAQGGVLSSPDNAPPRYRAELMRLMATFVDSELAGAAGFAPVINLGPGIKERIAAARIVMEKTVNANRVLTIMGDFGADVDRYANHHPWTARLNRDDDIGAVRSAHDMRLAVFNYPINGWIDAVVMNFLMGNVVVTQMDDFVRISYQPLAEAFREIAPIEQRHAELAVEGLNKLKEESGNSERISESLAYWWPRVARSFGSTDSDRNALLMRLGLRHSAAESSLALWKTTVSLALSDIGLAMPTGLDAG